MSWCLNLLFSFVYTYCLYQVLFIFLCENTLRTKINNFPVWESAPAPHTVLSMYHLQQLWRKRFCSSPGRSRLELFWTLLPKGVPWRNPSQIHLFLILEAPHLLTIYLLPCIEKMQRRCHFSDTKTWNYVRRVNGGRPQAVQWCADRQILPVLGHWQQCGLWQETLLTWTAARQQT